MLCNIGVTTNEKKKESQKRIKKRSTSSLTSKDLPETHAKNAAKRMNFIVLNLGVNETLLVGPIKCLYSHFN
jgi:hypothetical protein